MLKKANPLRRCALLFLIPAIVFLSVFTYGAQTRANAAGAAADSAAESSGKGAPFYVALTFDDGPRRKTTAPLLDGLYERGAHCTFFLIGRQIEGNEDLVERMEAEGHELGIHTYNHKHLTGLCRSDFDAEVGKCRERMTQLVGHDGFLVRPPYGFIDNNVLSWAEAPIILWSVDPVDWNDKNVPRIVNCVVDTAKDGDIILLHDNYPSSVEAALKIVDGLQARGAEFVTVSELFAMRNAPLESGVAYRKATSPCP